MKKDNAQPNIRLSDSVHFWVSAIAVIIFIAEVAFLSSSAGTGVIIACLIFAARQISPDFQYGLVLVSIAGHLALAIFPTLAFAHRGFDDHGFAQFLSALNLVILVPWALNLSVIRFKTGKLQRFARVMGSLGNATISGAFAFGYFFIVGDNFAGYQSEPTDVLVVLTVKASLLVIEVFLFVWLACLGE